jgi:hypothetical protein
MVQYVIKSTRKRPARLTLYGAIRSTRAGCSLGKGEVESSILSRSTSKKLAVFTEHLCFRFPSSQWPIRNLMRTDAGTCRNPRTSLRRGAKLICACYPLRMAAAAPSGPSMTLWARGLTMILIAGIVSACTGTATLDSDALSLYAAPGKYNYLDCASIATRLKGSSARETQLRELMSRANESAGGSIVNAMVYQDDLNTVRADLRALHKAEEAKKCSTEPAPAPAPAKP